MSSISGREQVNFQWDDDEVHFVLEQHAELDFDSASSLNQQSNRHVAPLGHIIIIARQPVFTITPNAACLAEKQQIPIFLVFDLIRWGLNPMIYHTRGSTPWSTTLVARPHDLQHWWLDPMIYRTGGNHTNIYTTDAVLFLKVFSCE